MTFAVAGDTVTDVTVEGGGGGATVEPPPHPAKNKTATRVNHFMGVFLLRLENRAPS
jgi:hypothetical protein